MTYVYVLVSGDNDFYYEQALMSIASLRIHMKDADVTVLTDDQTAATFTGKRTKLGELATAIVPVAFKSDVSKVERSRLIKTAVPDYISDDFLYIDCDTVICDSLADIEDFPGDIAGVLDGHVMLEEHIHRNYFLERDHRLGFSGTKAAGCNFNGGLIFARNTPAAHAFFKAWNEAWKYSAYTKRDFHDQSALNEANFRTGLKMKELPGEWNCQPAHGGLAYLQHAKIIHYYSSEMGAQVYVPYYKPADKKLQQQIKESGDIPEDIFHMLENPRFQFNKVHIVSDQRIVDIMQSPLLFTLSDLKRKAPRIFAALEKGIGSLRKVAKRIKKN